LLIGQALVAEAERRGYEIHPIEKSYNHRAGIALVVRGHAYAFEIVEMTDRLSMTEAELRRWRRDNRYRLSYRPELEPPLKQMPNARLKLSKQRSASLAEGVFVADIAAMERCPLVRTCDQRGRASAGPGRDCLRPCSSRLGRPGIALGVPVLSSCRTAWLSQFGGRATTTSGPSPVGQRFYLSRLAGGLQRAVVALPASDNVSTFRGDGVVEPEVVALAVANHVLSFRDDRFPGRCEHRTPVEVRRSLRPCSAA
jgi:hypothetical protein